MERGDQGKFFKNRPKSSPRLKSPKNLWGKWHSPLIKIFPYIAKAGEDFAAERGSKSARMAELWQISQGHPKTAFF